MNASMVMCKFIGWWGKAGTTDLKYDKNGNLTQDETFTYAYDWRNLITEVRTTADNALVAQYRYDALGRRVAKVDGLSGDVTRYVFDGWNVVEERDDSGAVAASYVYDERGLPIAMQRSGKLYFYHYNHLGSIESVTNSDGDVVEQYRYDPFGGVTVADGAGNALPSSQIDNPFFFAGQWRDSETGLYYMRHRYYSASLGRFTSRDPLEYVDGLNAYAYAMSNPVNFSDPLGLSTSAGVLNTGAGNPGVQSVISSRVGPYDVFPTPSVTSTGNGIVDSLLVQPVLMAGGVSAGALNYASNIVGYSDALLAKTGCDLLCWTVNLEQVAPVVTKGGIKSLEYLIESAPAMRTAMMGGVRANTVGTLEGAGQTVVVIGERTRRVEAAAADLTKLGYEVKTYNPINFRSSPGNLNRLDIEANRSWLRYWTLDKNAKVFDIGIDTSKPIRSPFYGVESRSIYQNWNYQNVEKLPGY